MLFIFLTLSPSTSANKTIYFNKDNEMISFLAKLPARKDYSHFPQKKKI